MKQGPAYSYHKQESPGIWRQYSSYDGSRGLTIVGNQRRYQVRFFENPNFSFPETIGKRICWIALRINELQARAYRLTYGSLP